MKKLIILIYLFTATFGLKSQVWVEQVSGTNNDLYSAYAFSSTIAWASGTGGTVLYTSTGGATWVPRSSALFSNAGMIGIHATGNQTAYCVCNIQDSGKIFKTVNAGLTWVKIFSRKGVRLNDIEFLNAATGFVFGNPYNGKWFVIKTIDAGVTFDTTSITRPGTLSSLMGYRNSSFVYQLNINSPILLFFGTSAGRVFRSLNGGVSWDSNLTTSGDPVYSITFINSNTGFAGGFDPHRTINGGAGWNFESYPNQGAFLSFANSSGSIWYTTEEGICKSTNVGVNFGLEYTQPNNEPYNNLSFVTTASDNAMSVITGWGVTDGGGISHYGETIGITPIGTSIPQNYNLQQNYPNPFNPVTFIQFDIPKKDYVQLKVYDALGNLVENIFEGNLKAGSYKADFDASNLASGIYFYTLQSADFMETRKMIVLK